MSTIAIIVSAVPAATPALAADGEILINQSKANAGSITPGDAAGFPVTLSKGERYKLSGNLTVAGGTTAIEVTANDVTVDLNGFTIRSNPPGLGYGIDAVDVVRVRVVNGTITGFGAAGVGAGNFAVVEDLRLLGKGTGVSANQQARIRNNTIGGGGGSGVGCGECVVEQNVITGNTGNGIALIGGKSVVRGNVIVGNTSFGMTSVFEASGYGENILWGNNGGGSQVTGTVASQFHPNYCEPACP